MPRKKKSERSPSPEGRPSSESKSAKKAKKSKKSKSKRDKSPKEEKSSRSRNSKSRSPPVSRRTSTRHRDEAHNEEYERPKRSEDHHRSHREEPSSSRHITEHTQRLSDRVTFLDTPDETNKPKFIAREKLPPAKVQEIKSTTIDDGKKKGIFIPRAHPMPNLPGYEVAQHPYHYRPPYRHQGPYRVQRYPNPFMYPPPGFQPQHVAPQFTQPPPPIYTPPPKPKPIPFPSHFFGPLSKPGDALNFKGTHPGYGPVPFQDGGQFPQGGENSNLVANFHTIRHPGYGPIPFVSGPFPEKPPEQPPEFMVEQNDMTQLQPINHYEVETEQVEVNQEANVQENVERPDTGFPTSAHIGNALGMLQDLT